jgi:hypothetical protein
MWSSLISKDYFIYLLILVAYPKKCAEEDIRLQNSLHRCWGKQ